MLANLLIWLERFYMIIQFIKIELISCNDTLCKGDTPTFISITGVHALTIVHSVFSIMAGLVVEILFMLLYFIWAENE